MQLLDSYRRRPAPGEFPPGWQSWFAAMQASPDAVSGAAAPALVDIFLQRPLVAPPRRTLLLNRWQAFATLWRQQWHPAGPDDRRLRWLAGTITVLWHLFFGSLLLWLTYLQLAVRAPPEGQDVVQVEYIGQGAPRDAEGPAAPAKAVAEAGAAAQTEMPMSKPRLPVQADETSPAIVAPSLSAPLPDVVQRDVPQPQLPSPPVQQPVVVSEPAPSEPSVFVLAPTTPRVTDAPVNTPELATPAQPVRVIDIPEPVQPISRQLPSRALSARPFESLLPEVTTREIPAPLPPPPAPAPVRGISPQQIVTKPVPSPVPQVTTVEIPMPSAAAAMTGATPSSATPVPSPGTPTAAVPAASAPSTTPRPVAAPPAASSAGTGLRPDRAPGGRPTPSKADDWGDSDRNRPGGQRGVPSGVYNSDGSVRLAPAPGSASAALPPGAIDDRITNLDRAGTWLKRKPNSYEPTTFDQYWRPNENLLQEWVRKSITTVRIPIPGTNKHIVCKTVLLALGGGCGISDPNLNEQPATARPPPDIPFKPELQEDNGSIRAP